MANQYTKRGFRYIEHYDDDGRMRFQFGLPNQDIPIDELEILVPNYEDRVAIVNAENPWFAFDGEADDDAPATTIGTGKAEDGVKNG